MKKILLSTFAAFGMTLIGAAQCSTSSTPGGSCAYYGDRIIAFSMGGVPSVNNSGCATGGYSLYATPIRTLQMGTVVAWTAQTGANYANGMGIWIDWNNNAQWAANECVAFKNYAFSHSGTLTVPYTAVTGVNLRMRVMCSEYYNFNANTSPCSNPNGYGETEDYYVYISCPVALPSLTVTSSNTFICLGQSATLTANGAQNYTWTGGSGPISNGVSFIPTGTAVYTVVGGISACPSVTNTATRTISVTNVPLPMSVTSSTTTLCAGTGATLQASGATSYTWLPSPLPTASLIVVNPTTSITYTAIGYTGIGCPGAATVAMSVNPQPTLTAVASSSNVCNGVSVTLNATGALTYSWTPGGPGQSISVTPSVATNYVVSGVNSFGCKGQSAAIVLVKASPTVNIVSNASNICIGGTVTLNASGANTYSWTGGPSTAAYVVSPTSTTVYTVTGTNTTSGCSAAKFYTVSVFAPVVAVHPSTAICNGAVLTLTASGAASYTWYPGGINGQTNPVNPFTTTVYTLTTNTPTTGISSCKVNSTVTVTVNQNPTVTASANPFSICKFATSTLTAAGASSYVWNTTGTGPSIVVTPTVGGTQVYSVTGTNSDGCQHGIQVLLSVSNCTSLKELGTQNPVTIYPNPNKGEFTIKYDRDLELNLVNELGQHIMTVNLNSANDHHASITQLPAGIYFIVGQSDSGQIMQKIIVK